MDQSLEPVGFGLWQIDITLQFMLVSPNGVA